MAAAPHAAPAAPLRLTQLPDDALVAVLGQAELRERLTRVAPVCCRLRQLCAAPQLLRDVSVTACGPNALSTARALLPWLERHAAHVQRLQLHLTMPHWCTPAQHVQLAAAAAGCLAACGAGGQLEELRLSSLGTTMPLGSLAALTRLRRLHAVCDTLSFTAELSPLTDVQYMQMHGDPRFEAPARLPSSLTCLQLSDTRSDAMPEQLTLLPGLQRLSLSAGNYSAASMAPLSRLTALTHLVLDLDVGSLPTASLASLTRLRFLRTNWRPDPPARHLLDAALQALQRLTCLSLASGGIPPAVGGLPLLQCFFWQPEEDDEEEQAGQPPALPRTHSLHSLRCLGLPWRSAAASVPALAAMPALQELCLRDAPDERSVAGEQWEAFWGWAARHPPLQALHLDSDSATAFTYYSQAASVACVRLQRARPGLVVSLGAADSPSLFEDMFYLDE